MAPPHASAASFGFHAALLAACVITTAHGTSQLAKGSSESTGAWKEIARPVVEEDDREVIAVHRTAVNLPFFDKVGSEDDADDVFNITNGSAAGIILEMKCRGCVDKRVLALLNILGLSLFGVIRCWLGDIWLGLAQAISIGGCGVWALLDTVIIIVNCLEHKLTIDTLEMEASFLPETVPEAYKVTGVGLIGATVLLGLCCCSAIVTTLMNVQGILMSDRQGRELPKAQDPISDSVGDIESQRFADDSVAEGQRQVHLGPKANGAKPRKMPTMDVEEEPLITSDSSLRLPRGSGRLAGGGSSPRSLVDPSRHSRLGTIARCIGTICSRPAQRPQPLPLRDEPAE